VIIALSRQRIASIDAFRGLTILVMVFVNQLAGVSGVPQWARHMKADADAMSFVDVVFPAFLFIVGMSIPFALNQRQALAMMSPTSARCAFQPSSRAILLASA